MKILRLKVNYFYGKLLQTLNLNIVLLGLSLSLANEASIFYQ